jgi:hypothetical protein
VDAQPQQWEDSHVLSQGLRATDQPHKRRLHQWRLSGMQALARPPTASTTAHTAVSTGAAWSQKRADDCRGRPSARDRRVWVRSRAHTHASDRISLMQHQNRTHARLILPRRSWLPLALATFGSPMATIGYSMATVGCLWLPSPGVAMQATLAHPWTPSIDQCVAGHGQRGNPLLTLSLFTI